MPILYVAVGRRLGYPLRLVQAKEHLFARWDDPQGERFNIECTSLGFAPHDDDYYRTWPKPISDAEIQKGIFLQNLRPREELALFLAERANCLIDNLRLAEALQAFYLANQFAPENIFIESHWAVATVMAAALKKSRRRVRSAGCRGLDLLNMDMPEPTKEWERKAIPFARENFNRIAEIHKIVRSDTRTQVLGRIDEAVGTLSVGHNF